MLSVVAAGWLTARWQRVNLVFQTRIETVRKLFHLFVEWGDSFNLPAQNQNVAIDRLAELKPTLEFVTFIYPGDDVKVAVEKVLATAAERTKQFVAPQSQRQQLRDAVYERFRALTCILAIRTGVHR